MDEHKLREIAIDLFIDAVRLCYDYDYSGYAKASLRRRVIELCQSQGFNHIAEMIPYLLRNPDFIIPVINHLSVPVTKMYRDPLFFQSLREKIFPLLKTYPIITLWIAGCATGEEVWSVAIMLKEAGLLSRTQIYATDINPAAVATAKKGIVEMEKLKEYSKSYFESGGQESLLDYYNIAYGYGRVTPEILNKVDFETHNLVSDSSFCRPQLILCRNVFIYFNCQLQNKVINLFHQSLDNGGFLCISPKESLTCYSQKNNFIALNRKAGIFQKQGHRKKELQIRGSKIK
ncbi:MAG: protein-glutamate O-methyltransferase CheR [gamma proteobacterium symbiont of Taylorina sp.]|nr:protein-glutamate O-methyltransferase CheR [gamma proteobacterium symbiont of Taylorina sp.]